MEKQSTNEVRKRVESAIESKTDSCFHWVANGSKQGMAGIPVSITMHDNGQEYVNVDWGMGVMLAGIEAIHKIDRCPDLAEERKARKAGAPK